MKDIKAQVFKPGVSARPGPARRLVRMLDGLVTRVQEWLEAPHTRRGEKFAYTVLALVAGYFLVRLCAFLIK
ncbi:hypothetical protein [Desulfallas thermosapovorans]|uniref:Uncharacterized protein n=1 Tax=Desulfallas thermosapovorans DSM 6562 TaxID=1121431 RepID=A0A5S4ZS04_9FIRM|nr:hypothetical protein [Desulfallas thermosapovorans]TYO94876.1 hypothetical protein LX24_02130 [Desulfallas thermosapovorans DSM 6562]